MVITDEKGNGPETADAKLGTEELGGLSCELVLEDRRKQIEGNAQDRCKGEEGQNGTRAVGHFFSFDPYEHTTAKGYCHPDAGDGNG